MEINAKIISWEDAQNICSMFIKIFIYRKIKKSVRFRKIIFIGSVGPDLSHLDFTPDLFEPAVCRQDERKNQNGYDTMILT